MVFQHIVQSGMRWDVLWECLNEYAAGARQKTQRSVIPLILIVALRQLMASR